VFRTDEDDEDMEESCIYFTICKAMRHARVGESVVEFLVEEFIVTICSIPIQNS
jgi:hypothetical protein